MNILKIISASSALSCMMRYSQTHLNKTESVLEHIGFVSFFSCLIGTELNSTIGEEYIDIGSLLQKAVLHDIDEIVTGDIPRPTKYFNEETRNTFEKIEKAGIKRLLINLELDNSELGEILESYWENSKEGEDGCIIAIADLAAVVYKVWEETIVGHNHMMIPHSINLINYLKSIEQKIDRKIENEIAKDYLLNIIEQLSEIPKMAKAFDKKIYAKMELL